MLANIHSFFFALMEFVLYFSVQHHDEYFPYPSTKKNALSLFVVYPHVKWSNPSQSVTMGRLYFAFISFWYVFDVWNANTKCTYRYWMVCVRACVREYVEHIIKRARYCTIETLRIKLPPWHCHIIVIKCSTAV